MKKITFDGKDYTIDIQRAKNLGILQEVNPWNTMIGTHWQESDFKEVFVLASVDDGQALLINPKSGCRWGTPVDVKSPYSITEEEFVELTKSGTPRALKWVEVEITKFETKNVEE